MKLPKCARVSTLTGSRASSHSFFGHGTKDWKSNALCLPLSLSVSLSAATKRARTNMQPRAAGCERSCASQRIPYRSLLCCFARRFIDNIDQKALQKSSLAYSKLYLFRRCCEDRSASTKHNQNTRVLEKTRKMKTTEDEPMRKVTLSDVIRTSRTAEGRAEKHRGARRPHPVTSCRRWP